MQPSNPVPYMFREPDIASPNGKIIRIAGWERQGVPAEVRNGLGEKLADAVASALREPGVEPLYFYSPGLTTSPGIDPPESI
jgi:hypothetical protein